jgi:hypothetical protein
MTSVGSCHASGIPLAGAAVAYCTMPDLPFSFQRIRDQSVTTSDQPRARTARAHPTSFAGSPFRVCAMGDRR